MWELQDTNILKDIGYKNTFSKNQVAMLLQCRNPVSSLNMKKPADIKSKIALDKAMQSKLLNVVTDNNLDLDPTQLSEANELYKTLSKDIEYQQEDYYNRINNYNHIQEQRKRLLTSSSKYFNDYVSYDMIMDFYAHSAHMKYVIESFASRIKNYIVVKESDNEYLKAFKKIVPLIVEYWLIFGKCTINFDIDNDKHLVVEDPRMVINANLVHNLRAMDIKEYRQYKEKGFSDYDPVVFIDALSVRNTLPEGKNLGQAVSTAVKSFTSSRYDIQNTIPVISRKGFYRERVRLFGGDPTFLDDNLFLLSQIELGEAIIKGYLPFIATMYIKDATLGISSFWDNGNDYNSVAFQEQMVEATKDGDIPMLATTNNSEFRVNVIPLDHLPVYIDSLIRRLNGRYATPVAEQVTGTNNKSYATQKVNYILDNIVQYAWERTAKSLKFKGSISAKELDSLLEIKVYEEIPVVNWEDLEDIDSRSKVLSSVVASNIDSIAPNQKSELYDRLLNLDLKFREPPKPQNNSNNKTTNVGAGK